MQSLGINGTIASGRNLNTLTSFGSSTYTYMRVANGRSGSRRAASSRAPTPIGDQVRIVLDVRQQVDRPGHQRHDRRRCRGPPTPPRPIPTASPTWSRAPTTSPTRKAGQRLVAALRSSVTTSYAASGNQGTETLGNSAITGGGNSFTFVQNNYNSLWLNGADVETDTASYSMSMSGTETYGTGGTISGGSDNFTWTQNAYDQLSMMERQSAGTGSQVNYEMIVSDTVSDRCMTSAAITRGQRLHSLQRRYLHDRRLAVVNSTVDDSGSSTRPIISAPTVPTLSHDRCRHQHPSALRPNVRHRHDHLHRIQH